MIFIENWRVTMIFVEKFPIPVSKTEKYGRHCVEPSFFDNAHPQPVPRICNWCRVACMLEFRVVSHSSRCWPRGGGHCLTGSAPAPGFLVFKILTRANSTWILKIISMLAGGAWPKFWIISLSFGEVLRCRNVMETLGVLNSANLHKIAIFMWNTSHCAELCKVGWKICYSESGSPKGMFSE